MARREREIKKEKEESRHERRGNREVRREKREERREQREERRGNREVRRDLVAPKMHTFPKDALVTLSVVRKPRKNWHSMKPMFRNFPRFA